MNRWGVAALLAALLAEAAAPAAAADFGKCDGYGSPNRRGDGMTSPAGGLFGIFAPPALGGDTRLTSPDFSRKGIAACDSALADSRRLQPEHVLRRASLIRARGMHRLAAGDMAGAIADFNESDRVAEPARDLYTGRSLLLGTRMLRAFAQIGTGDEAAGAEAARAAAAERPWDPDLGFAAARLTATLNGDWDEFVGSLRQVGRLNPDLYKVAFLVELWRGRFEEAIALHPHIVFSVPVGRGGYYVPEAEAIQANNFVLRTEVDGAYAYTLAATGDTAGAAAVLERLSAEIEDALRVPTATPEEERMADVRQHRRLRVLAPRGREAREALARWQRMVRLRTMASDGQVEAVIAELGLQPVPPDFSSLDLLRALVEARPELAGDAAPLRRELEARTLVELDAFRRIDLGSLLNEMPETELRSRLPAYDGGSDGALSFDGNGYMSRRGPVEDARTVKFAADRGTMAMVSEMVLLRAAEMARERGSRGMILLSRRTLVRTTGLAPSGHEAEIDVLFVDPANLPPEYRGAPWRVVDADQVWAQLSPIYASAPAEGARSRR